ncbi:acyltransferase domain-containing protein [Actinopolymorpha pittospori]|uniref:Acyltransferase n=1 Tax=Actinopolymorpha pittospori TaxID=648752 RepID=A0A927MYR7_9ACTN|nr:hypothetical protein [Actinopolymorpha pittospori]
MSTNRDLKTSSPLLRSTASLAAEQLEIGDVARQLSLSERAVAWLQDINRAVELRGPILPDDVEAEQLLTQLDVEPGDRADTLAARPDPHHHPALWWVLDRIYRHTVDSMGAVVPIEGHAGWPALPARTGAVGRHLAVWAYLAVLPEVRRYHSVRGIPDEASWASLVLGDAMGAHRAVTGQSGLGLFDGLWGAPLQLRGALYRRLGRLDYNRGAISFSDGPCGYTIGVHIPGGAPLDSAACEESFNAAREFFPRHFPEEPIALFHCSSWLLDPQLADYLPASSNIVQFQRHFQILPLAPGDEEAARCERVKEYFFGGSGNTPDLDELPQDTTLQRAYVAHRRSGRYWHTRTGWRPF